MVDIGEIERTIGYRFSKPEYLKEAITHRSYLNENPRWPFPHNERLEFLGDAVLELIVTEELYHRFPEKSEGALTPLRASLVNYLMMAEVAKESGLEKKMLVSRGEARDTKRAMEVILANAAEALIGAIYLDGGYGAVKGYLDRFLMKYLHEVLKSGNYRDPKSLLQEEIQKEKKITPEYRVTHEEGPEHEKTFEVGVYVDGVLLAKGKGFSKQEAEAEAAKKALEK
ncbi:MAG: ribonuclease III [Candidatus Harrisonbacteria bacterium]|nr:ribonuclease III [Candidatus Harrisonbacteria bacterium]